LPFSPKTNTLGQQGKRAQKRLLFWQKTHYSNNVVLRTLSALKNNMFVAIGSKYDVVSYNVAVKLVVWNVFAMSLESVLM